MTTEFDLDDLKNGPPWPPEEVMDDPLEDWEVEAFLWGHEDKLAKYKLWLVVVSLALIGLGIWVLILTF